MKFLARIAVYLGFLACVWFCPPVSSMVNASAMPVWTELRLAPPPEPTVRPQIVHPRERDSDLSKIDDGIEAELQQIRSSLVSERDAGKRASLQSRLSEPVQVELIFSQQVRQEQIDKFLTLGGEIQYIYRALSYGWNGTIPLRNVDQLPDRMGDSFVVAIAPTAVQICLDEATRTGRVRPIWVPGFAGSQQGFTGSPSTTIGFIDTGIDDSHPDLAGRMEYWRDYTLFGDSSPRDVGGHGTHVAGIALGTGAVAEADIDASGQLRYTDSDDLTASEGGYSDYEDGDFYVGSNMHLPRGSVTWGSTAYWTGWSVETQLFCAYRYNEEQPILSGQGTSPLSLSGQFDVPLDDAKYRRYVTLRLGRGFWPWERMDRCAISSHVTYRQLGDGFNTLRGVAPGCRWAGAKVGSSIWSILDADLGVAADDLVAQREAHNIKIVNTSMSLRDNPVNTTLRAKFNNMVNNGIVAVCSAGNNGLNCEEIRDPGRTALVITVGASNDVNQLTDYTSLGFTPGDVSEDNKPDVIAPGGSDYYSYILSADSNDADALDASFLDVEPNDYANLAGTSMAAPFVAGAAALVIQALEESGFQWDFTSSRCPLLVKMLLCATATETNKPRELESWMDPVLGRATEPKDRYEGYGLINPDAAVEAASLIYSGGTISESTDGGRFDRRAWARKLYIAEGTTINLHLDVPPTGDFDMYLYSGTPDSAGNPVIRRYSTQTGNGVAEDINGQFFGTETSYLVIKRVSGYGTWTLIGTITPPGLRVYVNKNAPGTTHDGRSWQTAYLTVQEGLNTAISGGEVWVAAGTYYERITLKNGVGVYGGFAGTETQREQRNWLTNVTVLDGNQAGSVVTSPTGANATTVIDGFTIRNGSTSWSGGGMLCENSSPTISNNTITGNRASSNGGGICVTNGTATISNNHVVGNRSSYGGGICCSGGSPELLGNVVQGNTSGYGAGIACSQVSPIISRNTIIANISSGGGGGLSLVHSAALVSNNTITGNRAATGGGIICQYSFPTQSHIRILNNVIAGNQASDTGGIYYYAILWTSATIANNTVTGNTATSGAGIRFENYCDATFSNNIITSNSPAGIRFWGAGVREMRNNCVFGNAGRNYDGDMYPGQGDISADPLFVNAAGGDYHLMAGSPCINAGYDGTLGPDWLDMDGQPRIYGLHVDIGADEFEGIPFRMLSNDIPQTYEDVPMDFAFNVEFTSWSAVGICPTTDHDIMTDDDSSFRTPNARSELAGTTRDFVVVNGHAWGAGATHYARVYNGSASPFTIEAEWNVPTLTAGVTHPHTLASAGVLDLYQVQLTSGHQYSLRLHVTSGAVDLALFVFKPSTSAANRMNSNWSSSSAGAGGDESMSFTADETGYYGMAVTHENTSEAQYEIEVSEDNRPPNTPQNLQPPDGSIVSLTPTLSASAFSDPNPGDTHAASQWQISKVSGHYAEPENIVWDSGDDIVHLTSVTIPDGILQPGNNYWWHVRYKDNHGTWSEGYSGELKMTTRYQIGGSIRLQDFSTDPSVLANWPITIKLCQDSTTLLYDRMILTSNPGSFTLLGSGVTPGTYAVMFECMPHWLRKTIAVTVTSSNVNMGEVLLTNGDCNGDNQIDGFDLMRVRKAYGSTAGSPKWDSTADLNGDGQVDGFDLVIVRRNFGKVGDP